MNWMVVLYCWLAFLAVVYVVMGIEMLVFNKKVRLLWSHMKQIFLEEEN